MRWPIELKYGELKNQFLMEEFSGATNISIEQEFFINLLLSNISALLKSSADDEIRQNKKESNKYRYQANRAFIIANIKWFIPRFLAGVQTIDMLIDIFNDSCTVLSQIQPDRKCKRKKKNSGRERKHFNNRKRVI